ncbi:hypothetical protein ACHAP5_010653 [Fusarium lateritium]
MPHAENYDSSEPKKLILCFDGTGNTFSGSNADTNVVKILRKLDRNHPSQFHYYQTGIGTYDINEQSVNKTYLGEFTSSIAQTIDQGFGTTFDAHVIAGYRFLMRYYEPGAKIYVFGFSRGAYTAKFLARMVNKVGLLCKGNEEMVPFAYRLYQRHLQGEISDSEHAQCVHKHDSSEADAHHPADTIRLPGQEPSDVSKETRQASNEIDAFSQTFCRKETGADGEEENIKVFFLGIWDCVASVAVLERKARMPVPVTGTATHVRHAVAIDERRVKFKPALLAQDIRAAIHNHKPAAEEDIKEVWFPGNHGDVGGGWPVQVVEEQEIDSKTPLLSNANGVVVNGKPEAKKLSLWGRIKNFFKTWKADQASTDVNDDWLQMSDIPLEWMIREVKKCGEKDANLQAGVHWCHSLEPFEQTMKDPARRMEATHGFMHDCLAFGYGTAFVKVLMWKFMEWLPFLTRWELDDATNKNVKLLGWKAVTFPPNGGSYRDIPRGAVLHQSLLDRLQTFSTYEPGNNHGDQTKDCFKGRNKALVYTGKDMEGLSMDAAKKLKESHFKIHAEKGELVWEDDERHQTLPDPPLTEKGEGQCSLLRENLLETFSNAVDNPDDVAIIVSPMRRTLQTAMLSLDWLVERGVKIEGNADWQENSAKPCDTGSPISSVSPDFPKVDMSNVDALWPDKTSQAAERYAYSKKSILARGLRALEDLHKRPEKLIFVVSHSGFLRLGVVGYWFFNSDYRVFDFEAERGDTGELRVKQQEKTLSGGLGLSLTDPVALGLDLPEEDPDVDPSAKE